MSRLPVVRLVLAVVVSGLGLGVASPAAIAASLTLYSAQHEQTVDLLTKAFTKETGIDVKVHQGEAPELASQRPPASIPTTAITTWTTNGLAVGN